MTEEQVRSKGSNEEVPEQRKSKPRADGWKVFERREKQGKSPEEGTELQVSQNSKLLAYDVFPLLSSFLSVLLFFNWSIN